MPAVEPLKSSDDIQKVRAQITNNRDRALFECGIHLALRGSDLLGLNIGQVMHKRVGQDLIVRETKNKKHRRATLNQQVIDALRPLIKERLDEGAQPDDPLFVALLARRGKPKARLTIVTLSRLWKGWCEEAGLEGNYGSHSGRKTKPYIMRVEDGVPIEVLMKVLNHSSPKVTMAYICVQDDEVQPFYNRSL